MSINEYSRQTHNNESKQKAQLRTNYDVVIVGGGLVGCSLALGLTSLPLKVALIDPGCHEDSLKIEGRTLALSVISCKILQGLCFGSQENTAVRLVDELNIYPINSIHISQQHHFSMTRLKASDVDLPALGYSFEMGALLAFLYNALRKTDCHLIPEKVKDAENHLDAFEVQLENQQLAAKLLIGADGDYSFLRKILNIPVKTYDYKQSAFVTTVEVTGEHQETAFERFIPGGSIALLPIAKNKMKLIWIESTENIHALKNLAPELFLNRLQGHLGHRLGIFHTLGCHDFIYPLKSQDVSHQIQERFVLMGNAAHTLHPIAAQGFNLSLRDIAIFVEAIREACLNQQEIGSQEVLQSYSSKRFFDQKCAGGLTHYLASLGSHRVGRGIRSLAFNMLECLPSLKRRLIGVTTGSLVPLPRWVY